MSDEWTPRSPGSGGNAPEETAWVSRPSQVLNLSIYIGCGAAGIATLIVAYWPFTPVAAVFLIPCVWSYLVVRCTRYTLTARFLRIEFGVLTRHTEEIELYRVEDTGVTSPLILRLFGLGNLYVLSSDRSTPRISLQAIPDPAGKRSALRDHVEAARRRKGVRLVE